MFIRGETTSSRRTAGFTIPIENARYRRSSASYFQNSGYSPNFLDQQHHFRDTSAHPINYLHMHLPTRLEVVRFDLITMSSDVSTESSATTSHIVAVRELPIEYHGGDGTSKLGSLINEELSESREGSRYEFDRLYHCGPSRRGRRSNNGVKEMAWTFKALVNVRERQNTTDEMDSSNMSDKLSDPHVKLEVIAFESLLPDTYDRLNFSLAQKSPAPSKDSSEKD